MEDYLTCVKSIDRVIHLDQELSTRSDELSSLITPADLTKAHFRRSMALHGLKDCNASLEVNLLA